MKIFSKLLILPIKFYQKGISPLLPPSCRYYPTCSTYMIQAIEKHGALLGLLMGCARILRCNPFVRGGYDPVGDHFSLRRNKNPKKWINIGGYTLSKKERNIQIIENEKMVNGNLVLELTIQDEVIGSVKQDGMRYIVVLSNGEELKLNSRNEAVDYLLRDYHLHRG